MDWIELDMQWIFYNVPVFTINSLKILAENTQFAPNKEVFHYQHSLQLVKKNCVTFLRV